MRPKRCAAARGERERGAPSRCGGYSVCQTCRGFRAANEPTVAHCWLAGEPVESTFKGGAGSSTVGVEELCRAQALTACKASGSFGEPRADSPSRQGPGVAQRSSDGPVRDDGTTVRAEGATRDKITVQQTAPPRGGSSREGYPLPRMGPSEAQPRQRPGSGPKRSCEAAGTAVPAAEPMTVAEYRVGVWGLCPHSDRVKGGPRHLLRGPI